MSDFEIGHGATNNIPEIIKLTGRRPSAQYNAKKNQQTQKNIINLAIEARNKHLTYGQLQAQKYLESKS